MNTIDKKVSDHQKPKLILTERFVISSKLTSDGATGSEWIKRLETKGFQLDEISKATLLSDDFIATNGVTYEIFILMGVLFFANQRTYEKILIEAAERRMFQLNLEAACLFLETFSYKEIVDMDINDVILMHKPIKDKHDIEYMLEIDYDPHEANVDEKYIFSHFYNPKHNFDNGGGFVFIK